MNGQGKTRRFTRLLAVGAVASTLLVPGSASAPAYACGLVPGPQRTIHIEAKALQKIVKRKKTVRIEVRTYRPVRENFADQIDLPQEVPQEPAGNVTLTVGILTGNRAVYQNVGSVTNDKGKALVKIKVAPYHEAGWAEVRVRAFVNHHQEGCIEVQEYGYTEQTRAFTVL